MRFSDGYVRFPRCRGFPFKKPARYLLWETIKQCPVPSPSPHLRNPRSPGTEIPAILTASKSQQKPPLLSTFPLNILFASRPSHTAKYCWPLFLLWLSCHLAIESKMDLYDFFTLLCFPYTLGLPGGAIGGGTSRDRGVPMLFFKGVKTLSVCEINIGKQRNAKSDLLRQLCNLWRLSLPRSKWFRLQC